MKGEGGKKSAPSRVSLATCLVNTVLIVGHCPDWIWKPQRAWHTDPSLPFALSLRTLSSYSTNTPSGYHAPQLPIAKDTAAMTVQSNLQVESNSYNRKSLKNKNTKKIQIKQYIKTFLCRFACQII